MSQSEVNSAKDPASSPDETPRKPRTSKKALRRRTILFVAVFVISVVSLLTAYEMAGRSHANDWYLFQVARSTSVLLRTIGYSCSVGSAERYQGQESTVRAALAAWKEGKEAPAEAVEQDPGAPPLTGWESWQYTSGKARKQLRDAEKLVADLKNDTSLPEAQRAAELADAEKRLFANANREVGPRVAFILKPSLATLLKDAQKDLQELRTNNGDNPNPLPEKIAQAQAEVERIEKEIAELSKTPEGAQEAKHDTRFSFILIPDCGAIPSMVIFFSAVLAFPAPWWKRIAGMMLGLPILYWVNAFRLAFLAVIGSLDDSRKWFNFAHEYVWQGIYIVFVVAVWMAWVEFMVRRRD